MVEHPEPPTGVRLKAKNVEIDKQPAVSYLGESLSGGEPLHCWRVELTATEMVALRSGAMRLLIGRLPGRTQLETYCPEA